MTLTGSNWQGIVGGDKWDIVAICCHGLWCVCTLLWPCAAMCGNQVASEWPTAQAQRLEELYCGRRNSFERTEGTSPGGSRVGEGAAVKRCQQFEAIPTYYCSRDMVQLLQQSHHVSFNIFKMSIPFAWHFNMFHHTSTYFSIFQPVKDVTAVACQDTISQFPHASCRARMTSWWRRPGVS